MLANVSCVRQEIYGLVSELSRFVYQRRVAYKSQEFLLVSMIDSRPLLDLQT